MTLKNLSAITTAWLVLAVVAFVALLIYFMDCVSSQQSTAADLAELHRIKQEIADAGPLLRVARFDALNLTVSLEQYFSVPDQSAAMAPEVTVKSYEALGDSELVVAEAVVFLPQTALSDLHQRLNMLDSEFSVEAIELNAVSQERSNLPELWSARVTLTTIRLSE